MRSEVLILLLEDNNFDAELIIRQLHELDLGVRCVRASDQQTFTTALEHVVPDLVLSDNSMRSFDALAALRISQKACPDAPFVVISGTVGEERAVEMLKAGVTDYVFKSNLLRLGPVLRRALEEAGQRREARTAANEVMEANRRFQLISQDAPVGIFQTDESGRFVFTNRRWSDITGVDNAQALGRRWDEVTVADRCSDPLGVDGPSDELSERFEVRGTTDQRQTLLMTSRSTEDGSGHATGRVGTLADISAEVSAESSMSLARVRADEASQLKSDFLANMTHEIRTPLIGVIGMADLLLNTRLDDLQRECAVAVRSSGEALMGIVNNILDFSAGRADRATLDLAEFDLRRLIYDVVDLLAISAQQRHLELIVSIDDAVPSWVAGDAGRLRRVITNVLGNAIKFTDDGEIVVRSTVDVEAPGTRIEFEISDTGGGMAAKDLATIFDPFVQVDASKSRQYGGTGLGLAISSDLVALMGGRLRVESEVGRGSTFTFAVDLEVDHRPVSVLDAESAGVDLSPLRLLIVDGNDTQRELWESYASQWGLSATSTHHYAGALETLRSADDHGAPFDVALVNRSSAGEMGLRLVNEIAGDAALGTVAVLASSMVPTDGRGGGHAHPAVIRLSKPVHKEELFACFTEAADRRLGAAPTGAAAVAPSSAGRILLAEDNIVNQKITTAMLTSGGYSVDVVVDGAQALQAVARRHYDAILMDCMMPVMNGFEATAAIRAGEAPGQHIPIIALTASSPGERQHCLRQGMDDFVSKPANKTSLLAMISGLLRSIPG